MILAISEQVQLAIVGGLVTALPILFLGWLQYLKVQQVEKNTNSMREQMVTSAKTEGHTEGVQAQKVAEQANGGVQKLAVAVAELKGHAAGVAEQKATDVKPKA